MHITLLASLNLFVFDKNTLTITNVDANIKASIGALNAKANTSIEGNKNKVTIALRILLFMEKGSNRNVFSSAKGFETIQATIHLRSINSALRLCKSVLLGLTCQTNACEL